MDPGIRRWLQFSPEDLSTLLTLVEDGHEATPTTESERILTQIRAAHKIQEEIE